MPNIESILASAVEISAIEERQRYVEHCCGGDESLRARVQELIENHFRAGSFLESPAAGFAATIDLVITPETPGTVIGPYKLLQQIGEGGMGAVYMAEQTQPVQRKVALKLMKPGMDGRQVLARFEAERQALALMDHPNIAKVLDAGSAGGDITRGGSGRPYFVMELVKGVPITRYCDEQHLTPRERLQLFVPVCQAVQHAHQKGIIHRDLKPTNVMVCLYDDRPVPKVIDFGLAKAAGIKLTERTLFTEFGSIVGTLEYMSPEQAKLNQLDIDTRSDIYSLGVLLYELLTGTTPLRKERFQDTAVLEVLRLIREEEPQRPSVRLSTIKGLPAVAANRGLEPSELSGLVRGELDWIVMKALEKDRNRRYETANEMALDIERFLHDELVRACPPSAGYRLYKFVHRNRGTVLAGCLLLLALLAGIVGTTVGLLQANASAKAAKASAKAESLALVDARAKQKLAEEAIAGEEARFALARRLADEMIQIAEEETAEGRGQQQRSAPPAVGIGRGLLPGIHRIAARQSRRSGRFGIDPQPCAGDPGRPDLDARRLSTFAADRSRRARRPETIARGAHAAGNRAQRHSGRSARSAAASGFSFRQRRRSLGTTAPRDAHARNGHRDYSFPHATDSFGTDRLASPRRGGVAGAGGCHGAQPHARTTDAAALTLRAAPGPSSWARPRRGFGSPCSAARRFRG